MQTQVEFLDSKLQILHQMHSNIKELSEKSLADIEQTSKEAESVTERCQQLVTDLAEAQQEEQMLQNELSQLNELRQRLSKFHD